jgi:hypothetical protein
VLQQLAPAVGARDKFADVVEGGVDHGFTPFR